MSSRGDEIDLDSDDAPAMLVPAAVPPTPTGASPPAARDEHATQPPSESPTFAPRQSPVAPAVAPRGGRGKGAAGRGGQSASRGGGQGRGGASALTQTRLAFPVERRLTVSDDAGGVASALPAVRAPNTAPVPSDPSPTDESQGAMMGADASSQCLSPAASTVAVRTTMSSVGAAQPQPLHTLASIANALSSSTSSSLNDSKDQTPPLAPVTRPPSVTAAAGSASPLRAKQEMLLPAVSATGIVHDSGGPTSGVGRSNSSTSSSSSTSGSSTSSDSDSDSSSSDSSSASSDSGSSSAAAPRGRRGSTSDAATPKPAPRTRKPKAAAPSPDAAPAVNGSKAAKQPTKRSRKKKQPVSSQPDISQMLTSAVARQARANATSRLRPAAGRPSGGISPASVSGGSPSAAVGGPAGRAAAASPIAVATPGGELTAVPDGDGGSPATAATAVPLNMRQLRREQERRERLEGRLTEESLYDIATFNPAHRSAILAPGEICPPLNDYHVPDVIWTVRGTISQFCDVRAARAIVPKNNDSGGGSTNALAARRSESVDSASSVTSSNAAAAAAAPPSTSMPPRLAPLAHDCCCTFSCLAAATLITLASTTPTADLGGWAEVQPATAAAGATLSPEPDTQTEPAAGTRRPRGAAQASTTPCRRSVVAATVDAVTSGFTAPHAAVGASAAGQHLAAWALGRPAGFGALALTSGPALLNYLIYLASWTHQASAPLWRGRTGQAGASSTRPMRPTVKDVEGATPCFRQAFPRVRFAPFDVIFFNQKDELRRRVLEMVRADRPDVIAATSGYTTTGAARHAPCTVGYIVVSGDLTFSIVAMPLYQFVVDRGEGAAAPVGEALPLRYDLMGWALVLTDSHGTLPWANEAAALTQVIFAAEGADGSPTDVAPSAGRGRRGGRGAGGGRGGRGAVAAAAREAAARAAAAACGDAAFDDFIERVILPQFGDTGIVTNALTASARNYRYPRFMEHVRGSIRRLTFEEGVNHFCQIVTSLMEHCREYHPNTCAAVPASAAAGTRPTAATSAGSVDGVGGSDTAGPFAATVAAARNFVSAATAAARVALGGGHNNEEGGAAAHAGGGPAVSADAAEATAEVIDLDSDGEGSASGGTLPALQAPPASSPPPPPRASTTAAAASGAAAGPAPEYMTWTPIVFHDGGDGGGAAGQVGLNATTPRRADDDGQDAAVLPHAAAVASRDSESVASVEAIIDDDEDSDADAAVRAKSELDTAVVAATAAASMALHGPLAAVAALRQLEASTATVRRMLMDTPVCAAELRARRALTAAGKQLMACWVPRDAYTTAMHDIRQAAQAPASTQTNNAVATTGAHNTAAPVPPAKPLVTLKRPPNAGRSSQRQQSPPTEVATAPPAAVTGSQPTVVRVDASPLPAAKAPASDAGNARRVEECTVESPIKATRVESPPAVVLLAPGPTAAKRRTAIALPAATSGDTDGAAATAATTFSPQSQPPTCIVDSPLHVVAPPTAAKPKQQRAPAKTAANKKKASPSAADGAAAAAAGGYEALGGSASLRVNLACDDLNPSSDDDDDVVVALPPNPVVSSAAPAPTVAPPLPPLSPASPQQPLVAVAPLSPVATVTPLTSRSAGAAAAISATGVTPQRRVVLGAAACVTPTTASLFGVTPPRLGAAHEDESALAAALQRRTPVSGKRRV